MDARAETLTSLKPRPVEAHDDASYSRATAFDNCAQGKQV